MRDATLSTIAQLVYMKPPRFQFTGMVKELEQALARCPAENRSLTWDCEDVALFDLDGTRVAIGHFDRPGRGTGACITVSVGPGPKTGRSGALLKRREPLCRLITDRIQSRFAADAVLWHEVNQPVTVDLIDGLTDLLPHPAQVMPIATAARPVPAERPAVAAHGTSEVVQLAASRKAAPAAAVGIPANTDPAPEAHINPLSARIARARRAAFATVTPEAEGEEEAMVHDAPLPPEVQKEQVERVRSALYPEGRPWEGEVQDRGILARRLAVHSMNTTLILVSLPVGAAMLTYSVLRGEDMKMTARAMALTGAVMALLQTGLGQQIVAAV